MGERLREGLEPREEVPQALGVPGKAKGCILWKEASGKLVLEVYLHKN